MANNLIKTCPDCGAEQIYGSEKALWWAKRNNSKCRKCATGESAKRSDRSFFKTAEYRKTMSESIKKARKSSNLYNSEECREKLRIAKLNQIKKLGKQHNYNPRACEFIDRFNRERGYDFQHAMNGGEIIVAGYSLDGYDKNKNVVFEYDEPKHNSFSMKPFDKNRETRIIQKINPSQFIRYDEENNRLYDVISEKEIL